MCKPWAVRTKSAEFSPGGEKSVARGGETWRVGVALAAPTEAPAREIYTSQERQPLEDMWCVVQCILSDSWARSEYH